MRALEGIRESLPDEVKDVRLNLESVLGTGTLTPQQRWLVALASAFSSGSLELSAAFQADAQREMGAGAGPVVEDARAAAALMAMNNTYYRFRHVVAKPAYEALAPRLRMTRMARPATTKLDFELACLAVSAIHGCETCVRSHEQVVTTGGLGVEQVHDAIRIAATVRAAATALQATGAALLA